MEYDNYGNQIELDDPDAGTITYAYNGFGELTDQWENNHHYSIEYDDLGRITDKTGSEGSYNYSFIDEDYGIGQIESITAPNGYSINYQYDQYGRFITQTEVIDGQNYISEFEYDNLNRIQKKTYPSGFAITNTYDDSGYLDEIKRFDTGESIWKLENVNEFDQITQYLMGNGVRTYESFDDYGQPDSKTAGSFFNLDYAFDQSKGLLNGREDVIQDVSETFQYTDNLKQRLNGFVVDNGPGLETSYYNNGNIYEKEDAGIFDYGDKAGPHAITSISNNPGTISTTPQYIAYTPFNKVDTITEGACQMLFSYGPELNRRKTRLYQNDTLIKTKIYASNYEKIIEGSDTKEVHYIAGPAGLAALYIIENGQDRIRFAYTDYLGSILALTDENGTVTSRMSFDAWGRRRNPDDWTYDGMASSFEIDRGFTGHEHHDVFGLINMNGRVYDPILGRFLSPDNYVQTPFNTQNLNRYTYCFNNPLVYVDPDGELAWFVPIIIGAAVFGTGNVVTHAMRGDINNFWQGLGYFAQGAVTGAVVGATWSFGLASLSGTSLLGGGSIIQGMGFASQGIAQYAGWAIMGGKAINTLSTVTSFISDPGNAGRILLGKSYLDENRNFFGGMWQGVSRYTWEGLQSWAGYNFSQFRNTFGGVDRVDYLGGATFATRENQDGRSGMSLGNFINITISDEIVGDFENRVITDPLFMHEYGHTFDSQIFGMSYLFAIGLPSIISAAGASQVPGEPIGVSTHDFRWYEMRANRHAERYFSKHYGVNWLSLYRSGTIETYYPRRRR